MPPGVVARPSTMTALMAAATLGGGGVRDVDEVGRREQHGLLEPVVNAQQQIHAVSERVWARTARSHRSSRAVEHGVDVGRTIHGEAQEIAIVQHEGPGRGAEQNGGRGPATRDEEARRAHGCGRCGIGHVGVVRSADDPELRTAVLEEAHRGEREV